MSQKKLMAEGHTPEDIAMAQFVRDAQARVGMQPQSLRTILTGRTPTNASKPVEDLSARQLRRRGRYGQAALLADQEALIETDPSRAAEAREASGILKALAQKPEQIEFDLWSGNVMVGRQFYDVVRDRLMATDATPAERMTCLAVLQEIIRWIRWESSECEKNGTEIGEILGIKKSNIAPVLSRLEEVGAITRVKKGRSKTITVTPEGAYRGRIDAHAAVLDDFKKTVVPLRPDLRPAS